MRSLLCGLALLVLCPVAAFADDRFDKGSWELVVGLDSLDGTSSAGLGYFLADDVEAILQIDYTNLEIDFGSGSKVEEDAFAVAANGAYNFELGGPVVPVVGGGIAYTTDKTTIGGGDDTDLEIWVADVFAGIRMLVGTASSVNVQIDYAFGNADDSVSSLSGDVTGLDIALFYSLFL